MSMHFHAAFARIAAAGLCGLLLMAAAPPERTSPKAHRSVPAAGSRETSPPLAWKGAKQVVILCQVTSDFPVGNDIAARTLCNRIQSLASRGAPIPVQVVNYGDPRLKAGGTVALLVQGMVTEAPEGGRVLLFTIRPERVGGLEPQATLFGAAPRLAPFISASDGTAWDRAIGQSLSGILPWLQPGQSGKLLPSMRERERN